MEATLPRFDTAKLGMPQAPCHVPVKKAALAAQHGPDVSIPIRFMTFGFLCLGSAAVLLSFRPEFLTQYHYSPQIVAVTHWLVLGFLSSVVMGALYQMMPVVLETRLHSQRLARIHFICHVIGVPGMVAMFWIWNLKQVGHFGSFFGLGVGLMAYNFRKTFKGAPGRGPVRMAIGSAVGWLTVAMVFGLFLASSKCWPKIAVFAPIPAMHAHAHLGIMGCFCILIVGVSYRMVPMFLLGELQNPARAQLSLRLLNIAVAGLALTLMFGSAWKALFAWVGTAGIALFGLEIAAILRARKRRGFDWALIAYLTALSLFAPLCVLGLILTWPGLPPTELALQLENVYGILALLGVVGLAIFGVIQKIFPFLVWYKVYGHQVGVSPVPAVSDLYSRRLQPASYGLYLLGLVGILIAAGRGDDTWARPAWIVLTSGVGLLLLNLGRVFRHLARNNACWVKDN